MMNGSCNQLSEDVTTKPNVKNFSDVADADTAAAAAAASALNMQLRPSNANSVAAKLTSCAQSHFYLV